MDSQNTRGMAMLSVIIGIAVVGAGIWAVASYSGSSDSMAVDTDSSETKTMADTLAEADEIVTDATEQTNAVLDPVPESDLDGYLEVDAETEIDTTFLPEPQPGEFVQYSGEESLSYAENGDVVLFFHADWCPSCKALEKDINANLSQIPAGLSIQQVDYDTATALKQQYGVVRQHTLVQVDANGTAIQTLTGLTNTLSQVVGQL